MADCKKLTSTMMSVTENVFAQKNLEKPRDAHLRIVFHDTAYLVHHVDAALAVKGIDQLSQVGITVTYGPVLQGSVRPLVICRVAVGKGGHLSLVGTGQGLVHVNPLTANLCCHQLQDVNT